MNARARNVAVALALAVGALGLVRRMLPAPPLWEGVDFSQAVFDRDQHLLRLTLSSDEKYRLRVPLAQISPWLVEATLLQEDHWFRHHPGVNPVTLLEAAWQTYVRRGRRVGGSTVTMQLARSIDGIDSRTVAGKLRQLVRALQLECFYSKDQLLEAYLNRVPYGGNVEGVGAASLVYFHKTADKLTLAEALTLTVVPQNPVRRSPSRPGAAGQEALRAARARLLAQWKAAHPHASPDAALETLPAVHLAQELPFEAPHFTQERIAASPFVAAIPSTLDLSLQHLLERRLAQFLERKRELGVRNGAAMLLDARSMEVLASVGSADFFDAAIDGQVNGTRAKRSPGSALKPFIYALGFDQGVIHPASMLKDAPTSFGGYNPENFDGEFVGPIRADQALSRSRNVPTVQVAAQLRAPSFYGFLTRAGVSQLRPESDYGLSLVLGSAEVTMEELVGLYAMLANGGVLRPLRTELSAPQVPGEPLLSAEASFMVLEALRLHPRPGQLYADTWTRSGTPVAWKTGTSHGFRDAWCLAVFGPYVLAVWLGNFDGASNPALVGVEAAAPLLFEMVDAIRVERPQAQWLLAPPPPGLSRVQVCAVSGELPGPHCPHTVATWFIPGRSPIHTCEIHRQVWLDGRTGRRTCTPGPSARAEVFEFWPSDLQRLFRQAGIPRRVPPGDGDDCSLEARSTRGLPPQITTPEAGVDYQVRLGALGTQTLPLTAIGDADVHALYWFLDEKLLGKGTVHAPYFWVARPGSYQLRVVDDQGRSDARTLQVTLAP